MLATRTKGVAVGFSKFRFCKSIALLILARYESFRVKAVGVVASAAFRFSSFIPPFSSQIHGVTNRRCAKAIGELDAVVKKLLSDAFACWQRNTVVLCSCVCRGERRDATTSPCPDFVATGKDSATRKQG